MSDTVGKTITCRAAVMWEPRKPLSVETIEVAPPRAGEVRIKMMYASICHSDENYLTGARPWRLNSVIGHEGAGIVESVGEGVTKVKPGDHVIPIFVSQCNNCKACKSGKTNICDEHRSDEYRQGLMLDGTSRFSCKGQTIYHYLNVSTFSQYTVVPERVVAKINPGASLEKMCLLGCGIPTGYGSAVKAAKVEKGAVCAVWGLGTIGLAAVMGCKRAGASVIFGIDINSDKFEIGKKFGVTEGLNPKDFDKPIEDVIKEKTGGGLDYAFECVGNVHTMRAAFESCHRGYGKTFMIGVAPSTDAFSTDAFAITMGRPILGALFGGYKVSDIPGLVEEYMRKEIMVDEFMTHKMGLDDINQGFDLLRKGKRVKRDEVQLIMRMLDPQGIMLRKANRLVYEYNRPLTVLAQTSCAFWILSSWNN